MSKTKEDALDNANESPDTMEIRLAPSLIAINPKFADMRQNRHDPDYKAGIKRLAAQLKESGGQKQAVTIRTNTMENIDKSYELVAGHRRYEAAVEAGVELLCKFEDMSDEEAIRWARRENFSREDFSPMEKARIIVGMRLEKMKTKEIAEELGVSTATVTQTEKLLNAAPEVQKAVDEGVMTMSAALEVESPSVAPEKRPAVVKQAKKEAAKEAAAKDKVAAAKAKKQGKEAPVTKKVKVEGKHVRKAVKAIKGAQVRHKAPNRAEIIDMLQGVVKRTDSMPVRGLCQVALAWIKGDVADSKIKQAFGDLANCITNGKRELPTAIGIGSKGEISAPKAKAKAAKVKAKAKSSASVAKPAAATHRKNRKASRPIRSVIKTKVKSAAAATAAASKK